jgi:hypothetical protein
MDRTIVTTSSELYIPARTLAYGNYELKLLVSMVASSSLSANASAYIQITPSGITANLVQLGTSMITSGYQKDLKLDPGAYSVDLDGYIFNTSVSNNDSHMYLNHVDLVDRIGNMNITVEFMV